MSSMYNAETISSIHQHNLTLAHAVPSHTCMPATLQRMQSRREENRMTKARCEPDGRITEMAHASAALRHESSESGTPPSDLFDWPNDFGLIEESPFDLLGAASNDEENMRGAELLGEACEYGAQQGSRIVITTHEYTYR